MCLTGAFSDMQKYRHNYNSCTTTTAHILTIVKYRKAFMMQVQKDALTSAASFSCVQLVRHFQEEHFNRFSCVLFPKLLTLIAAPNTLNLEPAFSLFPFCRGCCCFSGQSFYFQCLIESSELVIFTWEELWLAWGGAFYWSWSLKQFSILKRWFRDLN